MHHSGIFKEISEVPFGRIAKVDYCTVHKCLEQHHLHDETIHAEVVMKKLEVFQTLTHHQILLLI